MSAARRAAPRAAQPRPRSPRGEPYSPLSAGKAPGGGGAAGSAGGTQRASASEGKGQGQFNARGPLPCAMRAGQPVQQCRAAVARDSGGTATIVVTHPDGRKRFIFFEKGNPIGADLGQADGNMEFRASKRGDVYYIEAGNERYEIVEAFVFGG